MEKPRPIRTLERPLPVDTLGPMEKPLPMRTRLRDPSSCSSTPEAKRQRVHGSEFMGSLALSRAAQQVGSASTSASSAEQPLSSFAP